MQTDRRIYIAGRSGMIGSAIPSALMQREFTDHMKRLRQDPHRENISFHLHYNDLSGASSITCIIQETTLQQPLAKMVQSDMKNLQLR